jgi:amino acid adenylation domain-containing protein
MKILSPERQALLAIRLGKRSKKNSPIVQAIPRLPRNKGGDSFPLSFAQQRLWFLDQLEPSRPIYNCDSALSLKGPLQIEAISQSLREIINRHESLRTTFSMIDEQPIQVINSTLNSNLSLIDLSRLVEHERVRVIRHLITEDGRPFDLRLGPLLRATLLHFSPEDNILLITAHHIVGDGWSMGLFIEEMKALYRVFSTGRPSPLPELPIQYADFAVWERQWLQPEVLEAQLGYWRAQLDGAPVLEIPTDRLRPAQQDYAGNSVKVELEEGLTGDLKALSRRHGTTLYMTLLAGWAALLGRLSGQDDVVIGTPVANRMRMEIEPLIGFFVNTLALRINLTGSPSVEELLRRVKAQTLQAQQHQEIPFEQIVEFVQPPRSLAYSPFCQVMFTWDNAPEGKLDLPGLTITPVEVPNVTSRFDLSLMLQEVGQGIAGRLEYATALFDRETVVRHLGYWHRVLEGMVADVWQGIDRLPLLGEAERRQLVEEWNETEMDYPMEKCVHEFFEEQVRKRPQAIVLRYEGLEVSYGELNKRANQLAHYLRRNGVGPETFVGICVERGIEMVVGLLGVLKAGGAYVPMDVTYPNQRLNLMVEDAKIRLLLTLEHLTERFEDRLVNLICLDRDWSAISTGSPQDLQAQVKPDNAMYVIYTSGSTGRPKGVIVTHRSVLNLFNAVDENLHFSENDIWTLFHSYSFDFSVWEIWGALIYGGTLVVVPYFVARTPEEFCALVHKNGVTILSQTPSAFRHFIKVNEVIGAGRESSLRAVVFGGEALEFQSLKGWVERHGDELPHLINMYGITETTVHTTYKRVTSEGLKESAGSVIGKPLANVRLYVLDEQMQLVPVGVAGELYVAGEGVARGYVGREELTAERFLPAHYSKPGERLYKTGDLVRYLVDGNIEYLGRKDHQVKIRGYRIELGEIESALLQHEAIREAVVIIGGETGGDKTLVAYLVSHSGERLTKGELRAYLKQRLPDYMVPAAFVMMEAMPLTPNGKLDRRALPGLQREREAGTTSRTPVEELVASIFEEVLKVDRVTRVDNFFEIGGHSLLATQMASRVRQTFGVEIGIRSIFEQATVEGLAGKIEEAIVRRENRPAPPLLKAPRDCRLLLSYAQQRLWFIDQLDPGKATYNIPGAVRLEGRLNLEALKGVINEVVRRHEVLRTRIEVEEGTPVQVIEVWTPQQLAVGDLSNLDPAEREVEVRRIAREEARTGFDLRQGPLIRVRVLKLGAEQHVVFFTMHHIVSDAWSVRVLVREVCALYEDLSEGKRPSLPELELQYADYAMWQQGYLTGDILEGEVRYWKERLKGAAVLELPTDRARPVAPSYAGCLERMELGKEASEGLRRLSQRESATVFMVLMAAFKVLLMRYSGEEDISVGTAIANRTRREVEGLIGFFVNTLVLRTGLGGNPSFRELIRRERETALEAYGHQEVPFEKLVEEINPERDLSRTPLFQVMMLLENTGREELEIGALKICRIEEETGTAKFDLTLLLREEGAGIFGALEYSRDLFEEETIRRMARHYQQVVAEVIRDAEQKIREIELMSEAEKRQLIEEWNETERVYGGARFTHELIAEQVRQRADAIAVRSKRGELSYRKLDERSSQLEDYLRRRGIEQGALVGICADRSAEMVIAMFGILKAGAAYVPIDGSYPEERVRYLLEDAGVKVLLTQGRAGRRLDASSLPAEVIDLESRWEEIVGERVSPPDVKMLDLKPDLKMPELSAPDLADDDLAYVIYTSGSTGKPKGVMVRHGGLTNYLKWARESYWMAEEAGAPVNSSIGFDLTVTSLYGPLVCGQSLELLSEEDGITALGEALSRGREYSLVKITPAHLDILAQQMDSSAVVGGARVLVIGGEELEPAGLRLWRERTPETRLINEYGPTEAVVGCCIYEVQGNESEREIVPIGKPIANVRMYILDEWLEPAPIGARGEIYISGPGLARGYLGRPELTAERFIPNRFGRSAGERLYRTGDVGKYLPDGNIEFVGRVDRQVKIRGYRIELGEIESVLNKHRLVRQSVVVARADGRGGKRLMGYVVGAEGVTAVELKKHLRGQVPEYMVPETILILEEMPVTANGKIDHRRLPMTEDAGRQVEPGTVAPRTPVEEILVGIFEDVLRVDRIGVRENFFELGGHSLLATRVISRVTKAFNVEIGVRSLFEAATVEGLARRIEEAIKAGTDGAVHLVKVSRAERVPLSYAQQRLWFIEQLEPGNAAYNCPAAVEVEGELNVETLERVINEIVRRHETLRTRIETEEGMPVQVIEAWEPRRLEAQDLTCLAHGEREAKVEELMRAEARIGFDLRRGPLLRVKVLMLEAERYIVLFTMHHIVSDAWSMAVLEREICALYEAMSEGRSSPLPELEIQYADYASWQRKHLTGTVFERHLAYWKRQLGGKLSMLDLPTDHQRPMIPSYRGATKLFSLPAALTQSLRTLSRQEGVTIYMTLLAAFKTLLFRYTAQEDIIIGTSASNRNLAEVEPLIGFFVNALPMRTDLSGNPGFKELLKRVKEVALGGYAHQDLPFERMVEEIQPERVIRQMPLFNVAFGVQNVPREEIKLKGIKIKPIVVEQETARFDLALWVIEGLEAMQVSYIYSQDLYEEGTIIRMHEHFETLLFSIVDRPDARLTTLEILPGANHGLDQGQDSREYLGAGKPLSFQRQGIKFSTEPV